MTGNLGTNIAFAGLTAAGKTTHAKILAAELGYDYVSATEILMEIAGVTDPSDQVWFTRLDEIQKLRGDGAIDAELEKRLLAQSRTRQRTVFDTWALAWIGDDPLIRIWIESDLDSRARKCFVSQASPELDIAGCRRLIDEKDRFNRAMFRSRHGYDLFTDRKRYDAVLFNGHLIPKPTTEAAEIGISRFAPIVHSTATSVMKSSRIDAEVLKSRFRKEVWRITIPDWSKSPATRS
ncbi:cytidylate kinase family protein [Kutzneria chonburiensis]|uniref:Cytidylate kinase family protein n=1 Tax=Kutzneria chonburiensis TaxID=1483604 RepID=A0ABV6N471_9PSEU|nr:cytidylate kinase family protein [Kutzneria chonburiensis]